MHDIITAWGSEDVLDTVVSPSSIARRSRRNRFVPTRIYNSKKRQNLEILPAKDMGEGLSALATDIACFCNL